MIVFGGESALVLLLVLGLFVLLPILLLPILLLRAGPRHVEPAGWQAQRWPPPGPDPRGPDPRGWDAGSVPTGPPVVPADVTSLQDRLGHEVRSLEPGDDPVARQAMADVSERYAMCGALLERAGSPAQLRTAWHAAVEGLTAARVVRQRLGLDPGPTIPLPPGHGPQLTQRARVDVGGTEHVGAPAYEPGRRHYFPGGYYGGRPVPGGWYGVPFWESAVVGGAVGGLLGGLALGGLLGGWGSGGVGPDVDGGTGGDGAGGQAGEGDGASWGDGDPDATGWGGWGGGGNWGGGDGGGGESDGGSGCGGGGNWGSGDGGGGWGGGDVGGWDFGGGDW